MFKRWINDTQSHILTTKGAPYLEVDRTIATIASTSQYDRPADATRVISVVTSPDSGVTRYYPTEVKDDAFWSDLQGRGADASDQPIYWRAQRDKIHLWPAYSTVSHDIYLKIRIDAVEMTLTDYTTGTIVTIANGAKAVTGDSTLWTARLPTARQAIRIAKTAGDYRWYEIESFDSATTLTLRSPYLGTSIAAGTSTYTIGEMPLIPSAYHDLLIFRPLAMYYDHIENPSMADRYWRKYDGGYEAGQSDRIGGLLKKLVSEQSNSGSDSLYIPPQNAPIPSAEDRLRDATLTF
jgi:hypothetical protein